MPDLADALTILGALVVALGVALVFGLGWSLVAGGALLIAAGRKLA